MTLHLSKELFKETLKIINKKYKNIDMPVAQK